MSNVLSDEKREQVLALGRLSWPLRRIEAATGVRRETASAYLKAAGIAIRAPRTRRPPKPASGVIADSGSLATSDELRIEPPPVLVGRAPSANACEPYREPIECAVAAGRTALSIWQDLVEQPGFTASYSSMRRFVRKLRGERSPEAHPVIVTAPGEEAQVDYGDGPMVRHPETGKYRRTRLFVLMLGYSRKAVRWLVFSSSVRTWAELHERSFRRLGGATRVVVLDNLKEGVLQPDVYDPALNPLYRDVLAHYGVTALPCRVRHPDRKGKVESGVAHAQKKLRGLRFEELEAAQAYLDHWETRWADTRIHGTTKRQVAAMFAEEKPALLALPSAPFSYYEYATRVVHLDGCVEVASAYYGAPPGWLRRTVHVQWNALVVRLIDPSTGQLLREHVRQAPGGRRMRDEDRPARTPLGVLHLLARAERAGRATGRLCAHLHHTEGPAAVRRIQGMLSLVQRYGAARVEDACTAALELALPSYRFVRRYIERAPGPPLALRQVDPLIRELTHYRDLIVALDREGDPK
jgi:transposase